MRIGRSQKHSWQARIQSHLFPPRIQPSKVQELTNSNPPTNVLVTGASGFVALHCVLELLRQGYHVRGTLRTLSRETHLRRILKEHVEVGDKLTFVTADLTADAGWEAAVQGCDYVLHVASPLPAALPEREEDLIIPAKEGTLRVMRAAAVAGAKRVVLTSSVAAAYYGNQFDGRTVDENDWANVDMDIGAYAKSKTLAEQAAWQFINDGAADRRPELSTILPGVVLGPILDGRRPPPPSVLLIRRLLTREFPAIARVHYAVVDVRDVAWSHMIAMTSPAATGKRFCCFSETVWMAEIAQILRARFASRGFRVPRRTLPDFLVRLAAPFNENARRVAGRVGQHVNLSNERIKRVFSWQPRTAEEMIVATAESLIQHDLV